MGGVEIDTFYSKYLLSIYYIPYNVIDIADSIAMKIDIISTLMEITL